MAAELPQELVVKLLKQIEQDPQLPRQNPTIAAWQEPPHRLSDVQSDTLPQTVDFAIIGSGITGCSVAKSVLENSLSGNKSVTVFEARRLTTGATSRNGGFLSSHAPTFFASFAETFGIESATKIGRFCERTLEEIRRVAKAEGLYDECQIREVETAITANDSEGYNKLGESFRMFDEHVPENTRKCLPVSKEDAEKKYGLKNIVGAFTIQSHVFWPYKLVTGLFQRLLERYPQRLSVETNTPVMSITLSEGSAYPYILTTPRGMLRAAKVFHCTSGFTGHLLPKIRGPIFPCRLTMSCAQPGPQFGNRPMAWLWHVRQKYDPETRMVEKGLYWMQQNAQTGDLFYGGDLQTIDDFISSNDTVFSTDAANNLKTLLPQKIFARGWTDPATGVTISAMDPHHTWSGILSMTADQQPIVGAVPVALSGRDVSGGEWIAAGFNGYGMGQCWSSGEAIARMALGETKPEWLPDVFLSTEKRLTGPSMTTGAALQSFFNR
ncbi:FAD dependent oxidoreductase [Aspergillus ambiguus]|uniref:NAD(P)/FAD-dependent oxidoreductase n=1 Tax=Aspergillus ambiguus TaxID=176160 RepID=UPI003CCE07FE